MNHCAACTHYDTARMNKAGMSPCTQEAPIYRYARTFSPQAPCNKGKFSPAQPKGAT